MNRGGGESRSTSSFFGEDNIDSDCRTFSQLLTGCMSSPDTSIFGRIPWTSTYEQDHGGKAAAAPVFALTPGISPGALLDTPSSLLAPRPGNFSMSRKEEPMKVNAQVSDSVFGALDVDFVGSYRDSNFLYTLMEEKSIRTSPTFPIQKNQGSSLAVDHPSDDGYNWKKYGQKSVKGSDCPRSYYKCTHPKCSVTKKVERSIEGVVNAIIYKGEHNHPKLRAKSIGQSQRHGEDFEMGMQSQLKIHEQSSDSGNEEGDNDGGSDSEIDPKRRKTSSSANETVSSQSTVTKPKIVVHTRSDVDLLDDGYRWRKYGQKVVKGNCHPRSYYKCTSAGCNVRKHVERPSNEPTAVITTYEGKHNHTVPGAKNGIHKTVDENSAVTENKFCLTGNNSKLGTIR